MPSLRAWIEARQLSAAAIAAANPEPTTTASAVNWLHWTRVAIAIDLARISGHSHSWDSEKALCCFACCRHLPAASWPRERCACCAAVSFEARRLPVWTETGYSPQCQT